MPSLIPDKTTKLIDNLERLPVIQRRDVDLKACEKRDAQELATEVFNGERHRNELAYFQPHAQQGLGNHTFVFFGDMSEIPLLSAAGSDAIEYRLSILAREQDVVVIGGQRVPSFEKYLEENLNLGKREYLHIASSRSEVRLPTPVRCLKDQKAYAQLRTIVEKHGGATLVAHITTGTVWSLAKKLGNDTGLPIHVAGPLPSVSALSNDKLRFAQIASRLFGKTAVPLEFSAHGAAALTGRVHSLAQSYEKLVIKFRDSAGSAGNFPILSSEILNMSVKDLHLYLQSVVAEATNVIPYPLVVQVWERDILTSPSVQLWIPLPSEGPIVIEGVFEQSLSGQAGRFSGAAPASLPKDWDLKISREALLLGYAFQKLGYYGRCSFDTIITGRDFETASLHWIECNGRWGGVSVPMTFMNRLFEHAETPAYIIIHRSMSGPIDITFSDGLKILKDLLWVPGSDKGVIFISPSGFDAGNSLTFLSIAGTYADAQRSIETVLRRIKIQS